AGQAPVAIRDGLESGERLHGHPDPAARNGGAWRRASILSSPYTHRRLVFVPNLHARSGAGRLVTDQEGPGTSFIAARHGEGWRDGNAPSFTVPARVLARKDVGAHPRLIAVARDRVGWLVAVAAMLLILIALMVPANPLVE